MDEKKTVRVLWAVALIILGAISFFVLAPYFISTDFTASYIDALDTECNNAIKLSAGASGLATAISFIPSDYGEPLADQLAIIGVCFVVVISLLTFEKYMLSVSAFVAFKLMIPIACVIFCVAILVGKSGFKQAAIKLGEKLTVFSLILFLIVPATVGATNVIKDTHNASIEASTQRTEQAIAKVNGITSGEVTDWSSLTDAVKDRVTGAISLVKEAVGSFTESLAVMLVTSCLLPIAVMVVLILLGGILLNSNVHFQPVMDVAKQAIKQKLLDTDDDHEIISQK